MRNSGTLVNLLRGVELAGALEVGHAPAESPEHASATPKSISGTPALRTGGTLNLVRRIHGDLLFYLDPH
jgi:hypothetical protein